MGPLWALRSWHLFGQSGSASSFAGCHGAGTPCHAFSHLQTQGVQEPCSAAHSRMQPWAASSTSWPGDSLLWQRPAAMGAAVTGLTLSDGHNQDRPVACTLPEAELAVHAARNDAPIRQVLAGGDPPAGCSQILGMAAHRLWVRHSCGLLTSNRKRCGGAVHRGGLHTASDPQRCSCEAVTDQQRSCRDLAPGAADATAKPARHGHKSHALPCSARPAVCNAALLQDVYQSLMSVHPRQSMATPG